MEIFLSLSIGSGEENASTAGGILIICSAKITNLLLITKLSQ